MVIKILMTVLRSILADERIVRKFDVGYREKTLQNVRCCSRSSAYERERESVGIVATKHGKLTDRRRVSSFARERREPCLINPAGPPRTIGLLRDKFTSCAAVRYLAAPGASYGSSEEMPYRAGPLRCCGTIG